MGTFTIFKGDHCDNFGTSKILHKGSLRQFWNIQSPSQGITVTVLKHSQNFEGGRSLVFEILAHSHTFKGDHSEI